MNGQSELQSKGTLLQNRLTILGCSGLLVFASCVGGSPSRSPALGASPPPAWIDQPPATKNELCAIGVSGPSYYPEEALANSKAQALVELARGIRVKIRSEMRIKQQGDTLGRSETYVNEVSDFATEAVVRLSQIRSQWVNPGDYPTRGEQGSVYTLACIPLDFS